MGEYKETIATLTEANMGEFADYISDQIDEHLIPISNKKANKNLSEVNMSTDLSIIEGEMIPEQVATIKPMQSIESVIELTKTLQAFVEKALIENEDYGKIPGCGNKPTLLKPGAEKLSNYFGLGNKIISMDKTEDFENKFVKYDIKVGIFSLRNPNVIIAECAGSCNNREKKYINQDMFGLINTIQKMAHKRAFVGAIIIATRASHKFTCDIEDMDIPNPDNNQTNESFNNNQKFQNGFNDSYKIKFCKAFPEFVGKTLGSLLLGDIDKFYNSLKEGEFKNKIGDYMSNRNNIEFDPAKL